MPRESFRSFILTDAKAHIQHKMLLQLLALEETYVAAGVARRFDQNTSLKSLYNLLYSSKSFGFALHKACLDMVDNLPCSLALHFPATHRVRLFKACVLSVLHSNCDIFKAFVSSGYLKNINKRLVSVFTLFHLCLRSSYAIVKLAVEMDPEIKWPNPLFFIKPSHSQKAQAAGTDAGVRLWHPQYQTKEGDYSYSNWNSFTLLFQKLSPFYPVHYSTYTSFLLLKYPSRSYVQKDTFVFPHDLSCIRNDMITFNYIVATYPHVVKLSPLSFYLTTSCKIGLKLFYYNNEIPRSSLHYHAMKGNYEMVALILEVRGELNSEDKYGETPAMLSAKSNNFHTLSLLMGKDSGSARRVVAGPGKDAGGGRSPCLRESAAPGGGSTPIADGAEIGKMASIWRNGAQGDTERHGSAEPAKSVTSVLKNLNWMRRHVWNEKDVGTLFQLSNTDKARRFMRKLRTDTRTCNLESDHAFLAVLREIYKNRDVKAHNPIEYLFDAFGNLIGF